MTRPPEKPPPSAADAAGPATPDNATPPPAETAPPERPLTASDPLSPDLLPPAPPARPARRRIAMTRTSAMWLGVWASVAVVILLIIFVAQNTASVQVKFLWWSGHISLALALLIADVAGAIVALGVSAARIVQLRRLVRRSR